MNSEKSDKPKSKYKLKKMIQMLDDIKGRHTELVTVYIPAGANVYDIVNQLRQEQSTAENIKSKPVRKNVTAALEKIIRELGFYKKTPENGLAIFSGNASKKEGYADIQIWIIEPPEQLRTKLYWCDQKFVTEPLFDMLEDKEIYGIICLDKSEADIAILKGKKIEPIAHFESIVPGKSRAGGQCLMPESLVQLSNGEITEIKNMHNPSAVKSADFDKFILNDSPVLDKWEVTKPHIYKIITKNPRTEIESSKDHTFFVWDEGSIIEKSAEELEEGDHIIMPEKINIEGEIQSLNIRSLFNSYKINQEGRKLIVEYRKNNRLKQKELAKLCNVTQTAISVIELAKRNIKVAFLLDLCNALSIDHEIFIRKYCSPCSQIRLPEIIDENMAQIIGYFAGDGSFEKERLSFHENDKKTILYYRSLMKSVFNCNTHMRFREKKHHYVFRIYGKPIVKLIRKEFPEITDSLETTIPTKILKSPDMVLGSFLKGFFDAEGYVNLERGIGLGINNKKMAKQIQLSLLRFGILASLHDYDNRKNPYSNNHRYTITMTEKTSLELFRKKIGFGCHYKLKKLDQVIKRKHIRNYTRQIIVSGKDVRKEVEKEGLNIAKFPKVTNFFRNERMMSKGVFETSILNEIKEYTNLHKKLEECMNYSFIPIKISKIEIINKEVPMIDIAVKNKNFIVNCVLVHNSSARFSRVREGLLNDWFKQVAEAANKIFEEHKEVIGVLLSGSGPIKDMFFKEDYLHANVRNKVLGIVDTSYTGEYGLHETLERGEHLIKEAGVTKEKNLLQRFFTELQKPHGLACYGYTQTIDYLEKGAVDIVIINEELKLENADDAIEFFEEKAKDYGSKLVVVSADTREGGQFRELGGIGAILRYKI